MVLVLFKYNLYIHIYIFGVNSFKNKHEKKLLKKLSLLISLEPL